MQSVTVSKTSTYYLQIADKEITINAGVLATVTISAPIPYSINSKPTLVLQPAQSVTLKLNSKNWEISSGSTEANTIPNLVSGYFLTNNGVRLLWQQIVTGVSSVFGRTGDVTAQNGDYTASQVTNVPAGDISAVTVQAALNELDTEKFPNSMNTNRLLGRGTAGVGEVEEITLGTNISLTGTTLNVATMGEETLAETLVEGNTTGGTDIVVSAGDDIIITDATASSLASFGASKEIETFPLTQGDIIYASAANTPSVLAKDTNATRYLSNQGSSNNPSWNQVDLTNGVTGILPAANGGNWVLISTGTASASATIDFTGLSSTYLNYIVVFNNIIPATNGAILYSRVGTGGSPTYQTSSYVWFVKGGSITSASVYASVEGGNGADSVFSMTSTILNTAATSGCNGTFLLFNPSQTASYHGVEWIVNHLTDQAAAKVFGFKGDGYWENTTAVTAIRFYMSSGNITSGTFKLYGLL